MEMVEQADFPLYHSPLRHLLLLQFFRHLLGRSIVVNHDVVGNSLLFFRSWQKQSSEIED